LGKFFWRGIVILSLFTPSFIPSIVYLLVMKIMWVLNEILQPEEYHFTYLRNLLGILKSDKINLSTSLGGTSDEFDKKVFFLSLSRSGSVKQGFHGGRTNVVRIVFNGLKLNYNYSSKPVNYWGGGHKDEFEDRLLSDKAVISQVTKYIKRVDILYKQKDEIFESGLYEVLKLGKSKGVEINVYGNDKDMFMGKNKINDKIGGGEDVDGHVSSLNDRYEGILALMFYSEKYLDDYDLFKKEVGDFIMTHGLEADLYSIHDIMMGMRYNNHSLEGIMADIHNHFRMGKGGKFRGIVEMLSRMMRMVGVINLKQFYEYKVYGKRFGGQKDFTGMWGLYRLRHNYDTNKYEWERVDGEDKLENLSGIYFNVYKYGGYLSEEDMNYFFKLSSAGGSINKFLNYLMNRYTIDKVKQIVRASGYDNFSKEYMFKLDKV
jgi:hypothetical protein